MLPTYVNYAFLWGNHHQLPFPYARRQYGCSPSPELGPNIDYVMAQLGIDGTDTGPPISCSPIFTRPNDV